MRGETPLTRQDATRLAKYIGLTLPVDITKSFSASDASRMRARSWSVVTERKVINVFVIYNCVSEDIIGSIRTESSIHPITIEKQVLPMTALPKLDFSTLAAMAKESAHISAVCICSSVTLASWESVPLSLVEANLQEVGTLLEDPFVEPTFVEFHPSGTRYDSPDAPIAPRYFPYNRCIVAKCLTCGRYFLRYTEAGGYFVERRIRSVLSELLIDAVL